MKVLGVELEDALLEMGNCNPLPELDEDIKDQLLDLRHLVAINCYLTYMDHILENKLYDCTYAWFNDHGCSCGDHYPTGGIYECLMCRFKGDRDCVNSGIACIVCNYKNDVSVIDRIINRGINYDQNIDQIMEQIFYGIFPNVTLNKKYEMFFMGIQEVFEGYRERFAREEARRAETRGTRTRDDQIQYEYVLNAIKEHCSVEHFNELIDKSRGDYAEPYDAILKYCVAYYYKNKRLGL